MDNWFNYLEIPTYMPTGFKFMYIDVKDQYAPGLFSHFGLEAPCEVVGYDTKKTSYVLMQCDFSETGKQQFLDAMDQLKLRMEFGGYHDYRAACYRMFGFENPDK